MELQTIAEQTTAVVPAAVPAPKERTCRECGCTHTDPCIHPNYQATGGTRTCWWVEADLCSHCKYWPGTATRFSILQAEAATGGAFCD